MILMVMGTLTYLTHNFSAAEIEARQQRKSTEILLDAKDAVISLALQYREEQADHGQYGRVYGYLPLPDLGTLRNNNPGCPQEGCEAANFAGNSLNRTVIGRFPWYSLGTGPLRDGRGECLWYVVSGSHQREQRVTPMNWDTVGQLDLLQFDTAGNATTENLSAHNRPVAILVAPGKRLNAGAMANTGTVAQCGGDYTPGNYLEMMTMGAFDSSSVPSGQTDAASKPISTRGKVIGGGTLVANDIGLPITPNMLFGAIRKSSNFRTDINAMLDRIVSCLRDDIAAGTSFRPVVIPIPPTSALPVDPASPPYKAAGRIYATDCFDDSIAAVNTINPKGYFANWRDQLFVAACPGSIHTVNGASCSGALIFAGERNSSSTPPQSRASALERNTPGNYLENGPAANDDNLDGFAALQNLDYSSCSTANAGSFAGDTLLRTLSSGQAKHQDIVRCIPSGASYTVVAPTVAASAGNIQLASYAPATRTLTLGSAAIHSNYGATASNLFACAWQPEAHASGSGFRSYFRFRIRQVGEGFTFAAIDGDRNDSSVCGAARQHLGYSGNNGVTPYIQAPKLAIEFDTVRNSGFSEPASLSNGRNDPCYQSSCGASQNLTSNAHVGLVYWGYETAHATTPVVTQVQEDDNVHGFPWPSNFAWPQSSSVWPPLATPTPTLPAASTRPAPYNPHPILPYPTPAPDPAPGVAPLDRMGATSPATTAPAKREFHARVEVSRSFTAPGNPKDGVTGIQVQVWIEPHSASNISAMTFNPGSPPTLSVTALSHGLNTGDTVVIKDAIPSGYNGEYPVTRIDNDSFTATLAAGTPDPGKYISFMSWADIGDGTDQVTVTSPNHGLNTGNFVTIAGAIPSIYNGTFTITYIDANRYQYGLELSYEPGDVPPAIAAAKSLTPRAIALANITRPMGQLDSTFKPIVSNSATIYDEQTGACAAFTPLCPGGQACGSDNMCYRPSFRNIRLGFAIGERATTSTSTARGQLIEIKDLATTWLE